MVSQAERRSSTRAKLLDAAVACLVESGYRELTTTAVVKRAGLSQGALFRYYPSKLELVIATVEHVFAQLRDEYGARFAAAGHGDADADADGVTSLRLGLDLLVEAMTDPRYLAVLELYTASRTDPDLRAGLAPVSSAHNDLLWQLVHSLPLDLPPRLAGDLGDLLVLATLALQGAAVQRMVNPGGTSTQDATDTLLRLFVRRGDDERDRTTAAGRRSAAAPARGAR